MKHNSQRDEADEQLRNKIVEAYEEAYEEVYGSQRDVELSRTPVTMDSSPDDYKARFEAALELIRDLLYYTESTETDYDKSIDRYKELRDSLPEQSRNPVTIDSSPDGVVSVQELAKQAYDANQRYEAAMDVLKDAMGFAGNIVDEHTVERFESLWLRYDQLRDSG